MPPGVLSFEYSLFHRFFSLLCHPARPRSVSHALSLSKARMASSLGIRQFGFVGRLVDRQQALNGLSSRGRLEKESRQEHVVHEQQPGNVR
jgi:hypothetical protein